MAFCRMVETEIREGAGQPQNMGNVLFFSGMEGLAGDRQSLCRRRPENASGRRRTVHEPHRNRGNTIEIGRLLIFLAESKRHINTVHAGDHEKQMEGS